MEINKNAELPNKENFQSIPIPSLLPLEGFNNVPFFKKVKRPFYLILIGRSLALAICSSL